LESAIAIKPDDDAMAYLNLLYRRKADVARDDERQELLEMADDLVDKIKEAKNGKTRTSNRRGRIRFRRLSRCFVSFYFGGEAAAMEC
jgi:hypothetical protein